VSFKDQLKDWEKDHEVQVRSKAEEEKAAANISDEDLADPRSVADGTVGDEPTDRELFLQAVEGVTENEAILQKYDRADPGRREEPEAAEAQPKDVREKALFLQYVEELGIDKKD
jgi:hypothetical protein